LKILYINSVKKYPNCGFYNSGELDENSVVSILETTASDGKNYSTTFYYLDAGQISHVEAIEKAAEEYEYFRIQQDKTYFTDLDKEIKKLKDKNE